VTTLAAIDRTPVAASGRQLRINTRAAMKGTMTMGKRIDALQAAIEWDMDDGEEEFDDGFGDMIDAMHGAIAELHRFRREMFFPRFDEINHARRAAQHLVRVADAIKAAASRGQSRCC
jgi:hypothetical protein